MMRDDWQDDIENLMHAYGQKVKHRPELPSPEVVDLRVKLIYEEMMETIEGLGYAYTSIGLLPVIDEKNPELTIADLTKVADGIVDSIVVLLGAACACGIDIGPIWRIVQENNMTKANGPIRADGKRLKPEGWEPPKIREELIRQGMKE
jgi:predicted HAD superfamily Cof-like phosphohydrolase